VTFLQEIVEFVSYVAPTWEESNLRDAALGRVQGACAMMHLSDVYPFGSKASGLELWNSDIDVVVLGIMEPSRDNLGASANPYAPHKQIMNE
jgi:DNA polymerase sigma